MPTDEVRAAFWVGFRTGLSFPTIEELDLIETNLEKIVKPLTAPKVVKASKQQFK